VICARAAKSGSNGSGFVEREKSVNFEVGLELRMAAFFLDSTEESSAAGTARIEVFQWRDTSSKLSPDVIRCAFGGVF
jgi:hypothetical protein